MPDEAVPPKTETVIDALIGDVKPSPYSLGDRSDVAELAESIKKHNIIQPLTGRRVNGHIELVAGERRWRGAKKAGLKSVPIIIRDLTDKQAFEQLVEENLQRADLHPMEEARCFGKMRDDLGYTVEQLSHRFGKPKAHVSRRLTLLSLDKKTRKLYIEGKLDHRFVAKLARIPDRVAQAELVKEALRLTNDGDHNWELEEFEGKLRRDYTFELAAAPFDITDAKLVAKAGACSSCPKRTGQQRELFPDVAKKEDSCVDRGCYRKKVDVWWKREMAAAEANGVTVLSDAECKKAIDQWTGKPSYNSGYIKTDAELSRFTGDYQSKKLVKTALKDDPPTRILARTEDGRVVEMFAAKEVVKKLKAAGLINKATATRASSGLTPAEKGAQTRERRQRKIAELTTERAIAAASRRLRADSRARLSSRSRCCSATERTPPTSPRRADSRAERRSRPRSSGSRKRRKTRPSAASCSSLWSGMRSTGAAP